MKSMRKRQLKKLIKKGKVEGTQPSSLLTVPKVRTDSRIGYADEHKNIDMQVATQAWAILAQELNKLNNNYCFFVGIDYVGDRKGLKIHNLEGFHLKAEVR